MNLDKWMSPQHCLPDAWFRWFVILFACYIFLTYLAFSFASFKAASNNAVPTLVKVLAKALGWVFVFCAIGHFSHGMAYYHQYWKLLLLVSLPILAGLHTWLLVKAKVVIEYLSKFKSPEQVKVMLEDSDKQKDRIAKLETALSRAIVNKSTEGLKEWL